MLQIVSIALAQVKLVSTSENLLNKIITNYMFFVSSHEYY